MKGSPFITEKELKSFDFTPWGGLEGFLEASKAGGTSNNHAALLKRSVPDLSRAVDMTAVGVASLPFDIVHTSDGTVFDSSYDWHNDIGGIPNPQRLLYLLASSLCGGSAYIIPQRTPRMISDLQYVAPHTITPQIAREGLEYFQRSSDIGQFEVYQPDQLIYFWLPDSDIEIGPALNTPLSNATQDAMLTLNIKNTMRIYGERGFVPITLLGAKGIPSAEERLKAEGFFNRLLRGGFNVLAKVINADSMTLIKVGAGMDELKGSYIEILRQSKEDIAQAFGIPTALFMSDNAFASEFNSLRKLFYQSSRFKSIYQTIEETMTDQLLKPYGLAFFFRPETLDIFQEDESARANSLGALVNAINTSPEIAELGMDILGYDLTEEQEADLEDIINKKADNAAKLQEQMQSKPDNQPMAPQTPTDQPQLDMTKPDANPPMPVMSPDETKDLALWYSKAKAWNLKGKGNAVDWENKHLREEIAAPIRVKLANASNELDIVKAFEIGDTIIMAKPANNSDALKALAASIDAAVLAASDTKQMQPNINISMPSVTMPPIVIPDIIIPAMPDIIVNVPQQAAPNVTVSAPVNNITVQPAPAAVNNITVQPAPLPAMPTEATITTDAKGNKKLKVK